MNTLVIDIETVGSNDPDLKAAIRAGLKPPANYKNSLTIEKWLDSETEKMMEKTALNGAQGSIVCIGFKRGDNSADVFMRKPEEPEAALLVNFFNLLEQMRGENKAQPYIVGHNVADFDLRFILHRAIINKVQPPHWFETYLRRYSDHVYDTMTEWSGWRDRIKLDALAYALLGEQKSGSGADVAGLVEREEWAELEAYCRQDVELTYRIYQMMTFQAA